MILLCILILILCILYYVKLIRKSNLPGPYGIPILGYLPFLNQKKPYQTLYELSLKYGSIYGIQLGSIFTVIITDVNLIRDAFRRDEFTARAPLYITHGIMGGYGLICAEGPLWKDQRRQSIYWLKRLGMTKFGASRNILEKRIHAGVIEFLNTLKMNSRKFRNINPMNSLHHSLGNILNDLVFGIKYESNDMTWKYLQELQEEGVKLIGISGIVNFLPILRYLPSNQKIIQYLLNGKLKTHQIYDRLIENCQNILNENIEIETQTETETEMDIETRIINGNDSNNIENMSILKYFLIEKELRLRNQNGNSQFYNNEQLRHLLADLYGAGVDTTLTTLRWFLLYMAKYQNYQIQLRQKLLECVQNSNADDNGGNMKLIDLEKCDYLKACISETQRIRSVVPLGIPHGTVQDTILGNYKIPKNSMIIPLQWAIHMNPKYWPEPEEFQPNRFLNEQNEYITNDQFIPFQTGKRMCLGDDFAKMMLLLFAGNIINQFHIHKSTLDDEEINLNGDCGITLTPPDYQLNFQKIV